MKTLTTLTAVAALIAGVSIASAQSGTMTNIKITETEFKLDPATISVFVRVSGRTVICRAVVPGFSRARCCSTCGPTRPRRPASDR